MPVHAMAIAHAAGGEVTGHAHAGGQLGVVLRGTMTVTGEEGWWLAPPGLAVWVPPGVVHGARYSESSALINLQFSPALAARLPACSGPVVVSDLLRELAREAVRLCEVPGQPGSAAHQTRVAALDLIAQVMLLQLQRPAQGPGLFVPHGRDRRLRHAIGILRDDPGASLNIDELAAQAHTSARTLARLFVTETGMTFGRWREHLRIVCAVDKLSRGQSITQTALSLGYQSASSFTTLFTRLLGAPPRRYMQQLRERDRASDTSDTSETPDGETGDQR